MILAHRSPACYLAGLFIGLLLLGWLGSLVWAVVLFVVAVAYVTLWSLCSIAAEADAHQERWRHDAC